jgi:hypothetical protein
VLNTMEQWGISTCSARTVAGRCVWLGWCVLCGAGGGGWLWRGLPASLRSTPPAHVTLEQHNPHFAAQA